MAGEKQLDIGNESSNGGTAMLEDTAEERERKIMNTILNTSIILMSTLMGTFTEVIVNTTGAMASGMAEEISGKEAGDQVHREVKQKLSEVDEKMKKLISDVRKDVYIQLEQKAKEIAPLLSNQTFDVGPRIIEKYDFKLPKLTEALDDNALTQHVQLLASEDVSFVEMFKELTSWLNNLPKFPEKIAQK